MPSPIAVILSKPLSIVPVKSVCGLTRPTTTIASARAARASHATAMPCAAVVPSSTTSISLSIGAPTLRSFTPRCASIARCPSPVPPPCEPIAAIKNGVAPASRTASHAPRRIRSMRATPRLPAVIATRAPARRPARASTGARAACAAAATSAIAGVSSVSRTSRASMVVMEPP